MTNSKALDKFSKDQKLKMRRATKALTAAQREYQAALGAETGDIDRELAVKQAILAAERQINDAKIQQAQADLQSATTLAKKKSAIQRIYERQLPMHALSEMPQTLQPMQSCARLMQL